MVNYTECSICKQETWYRLYSGTIGKKVIWYYLCNECSKQHYGSFNYSHIRSNTNEC